jgi:AcrR family transcriptional regulator
MRRQRRSSAAGREYGPIFGEPLELPRGPHRLSRDQVGASQRVRLERAIAEVVAERGYPAATIAGISRRAGVSPKTFYDHFADKLDCYLAAYDVLVETLLTRMAAAVAPDADWQQFVSSSLSAYLSTLEQEPAVARAFLVEIESAGPRARERRRAAYRQFAALLKARHEEIRRRDPSLGPLPDRLYLAIGHAVRELVRDELESEARPRLQRIAPDMLFWITATVEGAAAAAGSANVGRIAT